MMMMPKTPRTMRGAKTTLPCFRNLATGVLTTLLCLPLGIGGCNDNNTVAHPRDAAANPCVNVDCSGHGQCSVITGDTAVCICDAGYHSEGLSCVENVNGTEPIEGLQPGEWYEIPNSALNDAGIFPDPLPPGSGAGVAPVMSAWSGGAYDTKRDRLLIWGGGHADYSGNEVYAFDMNTLSWSRIWGPTPNDQIPTGWETYDLYTDGSPSSRHTYNAIQYIPEPIDAMWNNDGSRWRGGSTGSSITWLFDLENLLWQRKADTVAGTGQPLESAYDSVSGHIFHRSHYYIQEYSPINDSWIERYVNSGGWVDGQTASIDPTSRKMLFIGRSKLEIFDLETYTYTSYDESELTGDTEVLRAKSPGFAYDPTINKFIAWSGESAKEIFAVTTYVIDPETLVIERRYPAATNSVVPTESAKWGTYGRFRYVPSKDVYVVVNSIFENVYVYKLSNLTEPPPGFGRTEEMGELRIEPTKYSIGIEWDISGDFNHNAQALVQYRISGSSIWNNALNMMRVDDFNIDMMAGSIMYLQPGTNYDIKLDYSDPDGGNWTQTNTVTTQSVPTKPTGGNVYHVEVGSGGGDGSESNPFLGIDAAIAVAQSGDIFLIHAGNYSGVKYFNKAGTEDSYIVWQAAGDGDTIFSDSIRMDANYNWFEGISFVLENSCAGIYSSGDSFANAPRGIVITKNRFSGADGCGTTFYFIHAVPHAKYWYITDNIIIGPYSDLSLETLGGEGIDMGHHTPYNNGHTIAYNSISHVGDGISYVGGNCDIFGNDIFNVLDDGIEPDYGSANVRIYNNRITMAKHNAISLQDFDNGMPWYIIRNQIISYEQSVLKTRQAETFFAFYHNTVVNWNSIFLYQEYLALYGISKNNLMISVNGGSMWNFGSAKPNWKTDIDYNAFDWSGYASPFKFDGINYPDIFSYSSASGLDVNSVQVDKAVCFNNLQLSGPVPALVPLQHLDLMSGCNAIDNGVVLPNVNDGFLGIAPDIGAYEFGTDLPHYGPRD